MVIDDLYCGAGAFERVQARKDIARLHLALLSVLNHLCSCRAHLIMAYVNTFPPPIPLKSPQ